MKKQIYSFIKNVSQKKKFSKEKDIENLMFIIDHAPKL
jgi:hypothetical protein